MDDLPGLLEALASDCDETDGWQDAAPTCRQAAAEIRSRREREAQERAGIVAWLRDTSERGPKPGYIMDLHDANDLADAIGRHEDKETRA